MEKVVCDICGSNQYKVKFKIDISENNPKFYRYARNIPQKEKMTDVQQVVECLNCGLVYTNPRFTTEELELVYSSEKIIGGNWKHFWYLFNPNLPDTFEDGKRTTSYSPTLYQWKFNIINKYYPNKTEKLRLLDVGCGDGKFVNDAIERGFDAKGVDLSPDRIMKGRKLYGLNEDQLRCMNIDEFSSNEKFDLIVMWDLIEHVESPVKLLNSLKKISHKETKIFALTMSLDSITYKLFKKDWHYMNPTQHLHYFSHKTIKNLFEKCDMDLIGVEMDDSKSKNLLHLCGRILIGQANRFFLRIYAGNSFLRIFFKPFQKGISNERMKKRIENLHPGKYVGRYHDNFVFVVGVKEPVSHKTGKFVASREESFLSKD